MGPKCNVCTLNPPHIYDFVTQKFITSMNAKPLKWIKRERVCLILFLHPFCVDHNEAPEVASHFSDINTQQEIQKMTIIVNFMTDLKNVYWMLLNGIFIWQNIVTKKNCTICKLSQNGILTICIKEWRGYVNIGIFLYSDLLIYDNIKWYFEL